MKDYKNLEVWKKSMLLVKETFKIVKSYPKEELYSLTSQTKRAAISVPSNIAEGIGRSYRKDSLRFMYIARGSLYELETLFIIAIMSEVIDEGKILEILSLLKESQKILNGLIQYYEHAEIT